MKNNFKSLRLFIKKNKKISNKFQKSETRPFLSQSPNRVGSGPRGPPTSPVSNESLKVKSFFNPKYPFRDMYTNNFNETNF